MRLKETMNYGTEFALKTQIFNNRIVSNSFRETLLNVFPRIHERKHYWPLLAYLLFPTQIAEKKILLARNTLTEIFGYSSVPPYFNTERLLRGFAEAMHLEFTWSDYNKLEERARVVEKLVWPKRILIGLEFEREHLLWKEGRVFLISGKPFTRKKQYRFMNEERILALQFIARTKETQLVLDYMNNIPSSNLFASLIRRNGGKTLDVISNLKSDMVHQWNIFSSIYYNYTQVYKPVEKSVRIFPFRERIVSLQSEVRKVLTHGLLEADLKNAQFAIAATLWNIPSIKKFLKDGGNMWEYLYQLGTTDKDKLKTVLYSLMFGMHHVGTTAQLNEIGIRYKDFIALPLIKDLIQARNKEMNHIKMNGGATTCFGDFLPITENSSKTQEEQIRSVLAQCCQAMELKLLLPVVELAMENKGKHGFTIALWQHDGFTIHTHSRQQKQYWIDYITNKVNYTASSQDIMTQLIWEEL